MDSDNNKTKVATIIKGLLGTAVFGLVYFCFSFDRYKSLSDEELEAKYEEERQRWIKKGAGEPTSLMKAISNEMRKRMKKAWENDPNRNPDYVWTDKNRFEK